MLAVDRSEITWLTDTPALFRPYVVRHFKCHSCSYWSSLKLTMTVHDCIHTCSHAFTVDAKIQQVLIILTNKRGLNCQGHIASVSDLNINYRKWLLHSSDTPPWDAEQNNLRLSTFYLNQFTSPHIPVRTGGWAQPLNITFNFAALSTQVISFILQTIMLSHRPLKLLTTTLKSPQNNYFVVTIYPTVAISKSSYFPIVGMVAALLQTFPHPFPTSKHESFHPKLFHTRRTRAFRVV